jgi:hypothetical protein
VLNRGHAWGNAAYSRGSALAAPTQTTVSASVTTAPSVTVPAPVITLGAVSTSGIGPPHPGWPPGPRLLFSPEHPALAQGW